MWRNWQQRVDPAVRLIVTLSLLLGGLEWTAPTEAAVSPPSGVERVGLTDETATPAASETATETTTPTTETTEIAVTATPEFTPSPSDTSTLPSTTETPAPSATPSPVATTETASPSASTEPTVVSAGPQLDSNGSTQPNLSLLFVENIGQIETQPGSPAEQPRFVSRSSAGTLYIAPNAIWLSVVETPEPEKPFAGQTPSESASLATPPPPTPRARQGVSVRLTFSGAKKHPEIVGINRSSTQVSYFYGNDPAQWQTDVPAFAGVRYLDLYPGLDLEITSENGQWVWRFLVKDDSFLDRGNPKALEKIRLRVEGVNGLGVDKSKLNLATLVGDVSLPLLDVVEAAGESRGRSLPRGEARAKVDKDEIIAPFSELPEPGGAKPGPGLAAQVGRPPFVENARALAQTGSNSAGLLYATYLGGAGDDRAFDIAVDVAGRVYVTGYTVSSPFVGNPGTFTYQGGSDVFVTKLDPAQSGAVQLVYSIYLGGSGNDLGRGIAVDGSGNAYVAGTTESGSFPAPNGYQTLRPGVVDGFLIKVNAAGNALLYGTYLGGGAYDFAYDLALDASDAAYLTGYTSSTNFPLRNAFDASIGYPPRQKAFIVRLNTTLSGDASLVYSTLLGGAMGDQGHSITVAPGSGEVYLTGQTQGGLPITAGAFQTTYGGGYWDSFIARVSSGAAPTLQYLTYFGGNGLDCEVNGDDHECDIAVDAAGSVYVTGITASPNFPLKNAFDVSQFVDEAYIAKLSLVGNGAADLVFSSYIGGNGGSVALASP